MKDDALDSQLPETIWAFITKWMSAQYPDTSTYNKTNLTANTVCKFQHDGHEISEEALCVNGNTGILSEAGNPALVNATPTVIITNTGAITASEIIAFASPWLVAWLCGDFVSFVLTGQVWGTAQLHLARQKMKSTRVVDCEV
jgi:hypothetical protein